MGSLHKFALCLHSRHVQANKKHRKDSVEAEQCTDLLSYLSAMQIFWVRLGSYTNHYQPKT